MELMSGSDFMEDSNVFERFDAGHMSAYTYLYLVENPYRSSKNHLGSFVMPSLITPAYEKWNLQNRSMQPGLSGGDLSAILFDLTTCDSTCMEFRDTSAIVIIVVQ